VVRALEDCKQRGKIRVAAYSGDNAELDWAVESGRFGSVQTSISICDQQSIAERLPRLQASGMGVIAKRPLAGAVWKQATRPDAYVEGIYWDRWNTMGIERGELDPTALALRFVAHLPGVTSCIVGTRNLAHFQRNLDIVREGPLEPALQAHIRESFRRHGQHWAGLI
jgi:aryl-alcohol dehydrogenase-like predicted oxidoreductase